MQRLILMTLSVASIGLAGCTSWAPPGTGGAAEDFPATTETTEIEAQVELQHELRQDLNHVQRHLDILAMRGGDDCFPASVHEARLLENRIAREIGGGLYADAETGLIMQRLQLAQLELKLDRILTSGDCMPISSDLVIEAITGDTRTSDGESQTLENAMNLHAQLYLLLNSDNQFALNSIRINPKYADNLAKACAMLNQEPGIRVEVVGHADITGETDQNLTLSARRADTVVDFLIACGVDKSRISRSYQGEQYPLYPGDSPSVNLVNRRVSISLIPE